MKVAAVTVLGQHPKGLDLHIRNLKWALRDTNYTIHIFTRSEWGFGEYENVEFHLSSVPKAYHWYSYWSKEVPLFLANSDADVFVFSEADLFYFTPLKQHIEHVVRVSGIVISNCVQHRPVELDGKELYPCIWEGGTIVDRRIVQEALEKGIRFDKNISNPWILEQTNNATEERFRGYRLCSMKHNFHLDTFAEFSLFCYFKQFQVFRRKILVHFAQLETMHRTHPQYYDKFDPECVSCFGYNASNVIFMYYLSGCYEWDDVKPYVKTLSLMHFRKLRLLNRTATQWMSNEQITRCENLMSIMREHNRKDGLLNL